MSERIVNIPEIGKITFKKSQTARRINISLRPFKGVTVTLPFRVSFQEAMEFVEVKRDWIKHHLSKIEVVEQRQTIFLEDTKFKTAYHELLISRAEEYGRFWRGNRQLKIKVPFLAEIESAEVQGYIREAIEETWRKEAKFLLPNRTQELAVKYGFSFRKVFIKKVKTRWGSCSGVNNINLSVYLMHLPMELIDYVILHELCHTKVKDHSRRFWDLLDTVTDGKARPLDKQMKVYSPHIY